MCGQVPIASADPLSSTSLNITWSPPSLDRVYVYQISYSLLTDPSTVLVQSNWMSSTWYIVSGLYVGIPYNFTIGVVANASSNTRGHACAQRNTTSLMFATNETVPQAAPVIVTWMPLNSSCVVVSWAEIPLNASGGIITWYTLLYSRSNSPLQARSNPGIESGVYKVTVSANTSCILSIPEIAIWYDVSVCGNTGAGRGPCSAMVAVATTAAGA